MIPLQFSDHDYVLAFKFYSDLGMPRPESGKFYANITMEDGTKLFEDLKNCTEEGMLSQEVIDASSSAEERFGYDDSTLCFKSNTAATSQFKDKVGSSTAKISI